MGITAITSIYNRDPEISGVVAESFLLPGNRPDQLIIVLDRTPEILVRPTLEAYAKLEKDGVRVNILRLDGPKGWRCPTKALNAAFRIAEEEIIYVFSSETIQRAGNVQAAASHFSAYGRVLFGSVSCSCGPKHHGVLTSPDKPMPYGQLWAVLRRYLTFVRGYDNAFYAGRGFDDSDLFMRLWNLGIDFEFTRDIHGLHLCHDMIVGDEDLTGVGLKRNSSLFIELYGTLEPWKKLRRDEQIGDGIRMWKHPQDTDVEMLAREMS